MVDYYSVLNLTLYKKRGKITDELVKRHYDEAIKNCEEKGINFFGSEERLRAHKKILSDAYNILANETRRKQYDELLAIKEEYRQNEKQKGNEPKNTKSISDKGKITDLNEKMKKSPTTKEMVEQIVRKAKEEYPIPKPEELER